MARVDGYKGPKKKPGAQGTTTRRMNAAEGRSSARQGAGQGRTTRALALYEKPAPSQIAFKPSAQLSGNIPYDIARIINEVGYDIAGALGVRQRGRRQAVPKPLSRR